MDKMLEFCQLKKSDVRYEKWKTQHSERGFADFETWNLDTTLCKIIADRLERYLEVASEYIVIEEEFRNDINFCIGAFRYYTESKYPTYADDEELTEESINEGIRKEIIITETAKMAFEKLSEIFPKLWW